MKYKKCLVSVFAMVCLTFAVLFNERNQSYIWLLQGDDSLLQDSFSWNRYTETGSHGQTPSTQLMYGLPTFEALTESEASKKNPLTAWVEDSTVSQGTYIQKDNSKRLIYPWAYDSDAFDLRRDRPFDWFDDDDPREANNVRRFLYPSRP
jgi:hypothetical protein